MFEGFDSRTVPGEGADIHLRVGGAGPPLLLLHGYPQTSAMWHRVAPGLAERFTVVAADLVPALDAALAGGGTQLVLVRGDRAANLARHRALTEAVTAAVGG